MCFWSSKIELHMKRNEKNLKQNKYFSDDPLFPQNITHIWSKGVLSDELYINKTLSHENDS